jgi:hypothetical protein
MGLDASRCATVTGVIDTSFTTVKELVSPAPKREPATLERGRMRGHSEGNESLYADDILITASRLQ